MEKIAVTVAGKGRWVDRRKIALWNGWDARFLFLQQFSLGKIGPANHQLAGKHTAFFNRNRPRCDITFEGAFFLNRHDLGNDLSGHSSFDFDAFRANPPKAMNIRFALDDDVPGANAARNFASEVDRRGVVAMQVATQSAFD